jgi:hypothetical protein
MRFTRFGVLITFLLASLGVSWALRLMARDKPNYSRIERGLYLGGHVESPPPGTTAVLNLCEWNDPYACEHHVWAAIPDRAPAPSLAWLREQVDFIAEQREAGRTVYVHCFNGVSRGPMVVCAYLMFKHGWTRDEALAWLRERRPQTRPNPAFMELLDEWEKSPR